MSDKELLNEKTVLKIADEIGEVIKDYFASYLISEGSDAIEVAIRNILMKVKEEERIEELEKTTIWCILCGEPILYGQMGYQVPFRDKSNVHEICKQKFDEATKKEPKRGFYE